MNDGKYDCNFCNFKTEYMIKIYEHKLQEHPDASDEFNSKKITAKDMAVNLLAEQNLELMEKLVALENGIKATFGTLVDEVGNRINTVVTDSK